MNVHADDAAKGSTMTDPTPTTTTAPGWAVLGPGSIARRFLSQLPASERDARLVAAGSSSAERAEAFATEAADHGFADVTGADYDAVLADPAVDAVYISTVHTGHADLVIRALDAGKAVLCEKPLAVNHGTAMALVDAARTAGLPLVEAYMYRFHPQTAALSSCCARASSARSPTSTRPSPSAPDPAPAASTTPRPRAAGSSTSAATPSPPRPPSCRPRPGSPSPSRSRSRWTERSARPASTSGPSPGWPTAAAPGSRASPPRSARASRSTSRRRLTILGSKGRIHLSDPWTLGDAPTIEVSVVGEEPRTLTFAGAKPYAIEADATTDALAAGLGEAAQMTLDETLATARTLDRWRAALELRYPFEAEDADIPTVSGRPLAVRDDSPMLYGEIPGVGKRMSRLVMGVDNQPDLAHASAIFDHFVEQGGNAFDTGYIYGGGVLEGRLGKWIQNRGIREDVVVITKGAHTPHCDPESLTSQLLESLDRQGTDYADIYLMHRDNLEVPVGEFVDVMDEHQRAGRILSYGVSNWTPERFDEAQAYAKANGRAGFQALSDHFGLAEAYDVPWAGCVHVTDPASKAWLEERQIPLLPWSSQARGFFTGRARPDDLSDPELVRCYYGDDNFERLRRAEQLGAEHGVQATAIALAYVLAQPFPTFPLFGPRTITEVRSSMRGLSVELTPEQVAWLDLRG